MIKFFVHKYPAVFFMCALILIMGTVSYLTLPRESAPEVKVPLIFVNTTYPGISGKDMETLITSEIEDELEGIEGLNKITSASRQGVSAISVEFVPNTDVEIALRRVKERVDIAKVDIPPEANEPFVKELNFSDQPIIIIVISHPDGLEILNNTVDKLEDDFKRVKGVLEVNVSGKLERELAIEVNPLLLKQFGLALEDVINAVRNENVTIPGGVLNTSFQNFSLSVSGEIKDPKQFEEIIVKNNFSKVRLGNLAKVKLKYKDPETITRLNGQPSISLSITKRTGENILSIANEIKKIIEKGQESFPPNTEIDYSFDDSKTIKLMVEDLENNIVSGFILVFAVTLIFLGFSNAFFVAIAIPFSMLISAIVLQFMGITLNMMVLFSSILALGMLVDNGIVIVENIFRHGVEGKSKFKAAVDGTMEVAWPVATSTLTTLLAFFPIIFMPGMMGDFMSFLPKTVIIILTSSLFVALTITPVFCSKFLGISKSKQDKFSSGGSTFQSIQKWYEKLLVKSLRIPGIVLIISVVMSIFGMVMYGMSERGMLFFPTIDPPATVVDIKLPHGTPIHKTDSLTKEVEEVIGKIESSVDHLQVTSGNGAQEMFFSGVQETHLSNIRLGFAPYIERKIKGSETTELVSEKVKAFSGMEIKVKKQEGGPPTGHPISYAVTGFEYNNLGIYGDSIKQIIETHTSGLENIDWDFEKAKPQIRIEIDRAKAARLGLNTRKVASTIKDAINGSEISKIRMGQNEYGVIIRYDKEFRNSLMDLKNLEIIHEGKNIPLSNIAKVTNDMDLGVIKRKNLKRSVEIWADFKLGVTGKEQKRIKGNIDTLVNELAKRIPPTKDVHIGAGEGEQIQTEAMVFLMQAFIIAVFLILIVLIVQFNSITQPFIILFAVFLSVGGVFWGFYLSGNVFVAIMSGIGTISLAGVVVNNGIVLLDFINQLRNKGLDIKDAVIEASKTRLRPVLLTAITTILGLIPMAIGISFDVHTFGIQSDSESSQWWTSLAWAVIYGLAFATVLTLVVVPCAVMVDYKFRHYLKTKYPSRSKS